MKWGKLFKPVNNLDTNSAREFMGTHAEGSYTLLDVRQPAEYEKTRIPGATLIPLPQLVDRINEIDSDKPVIVY